MVASRARTITGVVLIVMILWWIQPTGLDFKVYRDGGHTFLHDSALLYGHLQSSDPTPTGLPFTYPPFAALLFVPFSLLPFKIATWCMTALSIAGLYFVAVDLTQRLPLVAPRWRGLRAWLTTPTVLTAALLATASFGITIWFGQINIILLTACYLTAARFGIGKTLAVVIGICGGIKLTPLALALVFVPRRDLASILSVGASFAGTILLGFLAAPAAATQYWTDVLWDPSRVGRLNFFTNFSIRGVTEDAGLPSLLWVGLVVAVIAAVTGLLWHYRRSGVLLPVDELALAALVMVLISPVTWSHHWVWFPMIGLAFWKISATHEATLKVATRVFLVLGAIPTVLWLRKIFVDLGYEPDGGQLPVWAPILTHGTVVASLVVLTLAVVAMAASAQRPRRTIILINAAQPDSAS